MPTLTIRNVEDGVHSFLRKQAAEHGHSMEAEVRDILKQTMRSKQGKPGEVAQHIHDIFARIGGADDLVLPERDKDVPEPMTFKK